MFVIRLIFCLLCFVGIVLADEISTISFSNLSYSPLTSLNYPHEGWTASFEFDIAETVHQNDYFIMSFPLVYRIKFDGDNSSTTISLNDGVEAFECYVSQQAAYLYDSTIFRCDAITDLSSYSDMSGSITFSFSFSSGGSIYEPELHDAGLLYAGTMEVPLTDEISAAITFDQAIFDSDIYTIGRTTTYNSLETYYLGMGCPNGYLLEGSQTINYDKTNNSCNLDCSSIQSYMADSFNDWSLPLDYKNAQAEVSCISNTLQISIKEASAGEMFWVNALQSVSEGINTIEHDVQMQYTCSDTVYGTTYSTQFQTVVEYVIYQGEAFATASVTSGSSKSPQQTSSLNSTFSIQPSISKSLSSAFISSTSLTNSSTKPFPVSSTVSVAASSINTSLTAPETSLSTVVELSSYTTFFSTTTTSWTGDYTTTYSTQTTEGGSQNVFTEEIVFYVRTPTVVGISSSTTTTTISCSVCNSSGGSSLVSPSSVSLTGTTSSSQSPSTSNIVSSKANSTSSPSSLSSASTSRLSSSATFLTSNLTSTSPLSISSATRPLSASTSIVLTSTSLSTLTRSTSDSFSFSARSTSFPSLSSTTVDVSLSSTTVDSSLSSTTVASSLSSTTVASSLSSTTVASSLSSTTVASSLSSTTVDSSLSSTTVDSSLSSNSVDSSLSSTTGSPLASTTTGPFLSSTFSTPNLTITLSPSASGISSSEINSSVISVALTTSISDSVPIATETFDSSNVTPSYISNSSSMVSTSSNVVSMTSTFKTTTLEEKSFTSYSLQSSITIPPSIFTSKIPSLSTLSTDGSSANYVSSFTETVNSSVRADLSTSSSQMLSTHRILSESSIPLAGISESHESLASSLPTEPRTGDTAHSLTSFAISSKTLESYTPSEKNTDSVVSSAPIVNLTETTKHQAITATNSTGIAKSMRTIGSVSLTEILSSDSIAPVVSKTNTIAATSIPISSHISEGSTFFKFTTLANSSSNMYPSSTISTPLPNKVSFYLTTQTQNATVMTKTVTQSIAGSITIVGTTSAFSALSLAHIPASSQSSISVYEGKALSQRTGLLIAIMSSLLSCFLV